ncbi:MAG: hypothetical protein GY853_00610, partial [PVC group bacterium]|nr:hypothetical protein [PVC group bacterium]
DPNKNTNPSGPKVPVKKVDPDNDNTPIKDTTLDTKKDNKKMILMLMMTMMIQPQLLLITIITIIATIIKTITLILVILLQTKTKTIIQGHMRKKKKMTLENFSIYTGRTLKKKKL